MRVNEAYIGKRELSCQLDMYLNVMFDQVHRSNNTDRRSVSGRCRYFVTGVTDQSYSPLITDSSLMEQSNYKECTPRMIRMIFENFRSRKSADGVQVDVRKLINSKIGYWVRFWAFGIISNIWYRFWYFVSDLGLGRDIGDIGSIIGVQATHFGYVVQEVDQAEVDISLKSIIQGRVGIVTVRY